MFAVGIDKEITQREKKKKTTTTGNVCFCCKDIWLCRERISEYIKCLLFRFSFSCFATLVNSMTLDLVNIHTTGLHGSRITVITQLIITITISSNVIGA